MADLKHVARLVDLDHIADQKHSNDSHVAHDDSTADHAASSHVAGSHSGKHRAGPGQINWFSTSYTGGCAGENAKFDSPPLGFAIFNFSLLIAGIVWAVRKNRVGASLKQAQDNVREQIEIASRMRDEAEAKMADVQRRADALESDLVEMRTNAKKAAEAEKSRILAEAKQEADRLQKQGTRAVEQEFKKAQASLATDTLSLACSMAQGMLVSEVNATDHSRLQDQFIEKLLSTKGPIVGGSTTSGGTTGSGSSSTGRTANIMTQRTSTTIPTATKSAISALEGVKRGGSLT